MNDITKPLSNLQAEILKIFSFDISEKQLEDVKQLLANYFANSATEEMDKFFESNKWDDSKINDLAHQHLRTTKK